MENGDKGIVVYKHNRIGDTYRVNRIILDLSLLNTPENRFAIQCMIHDTNLVEVLPDGTHLWKGRKDKHGYPLISTKQLPDRPVDENGRLKPAKTIRLHRLLQEMFNGGAKTNAYVLHRDDNPSNVNIDNLFNGTAANNSTMIILHNRRVYPSGQNHWNCKIKDADIVEMIHLHYANAYTIRDLADMFGVSPGYAGKLINGHYRQYITQKAIKAAIANRD